jgi:threonine aldolase
VFVISSEEGKKYSFKNDYSEGAHAKILKSLATTNLDQQAGYGVDDYSQQDIR